MYDSIVGGTAFEGRLGVSANKGTWPKLKRNTGASGLIRGSGINLKIYLQNSGEQRDFLKGTGEQAEIRREQENKEHAPPPK